MTLLPLALLLCVVLIVIKLVRRRNPMDVAGAKSEYLAREAGTFPAKMPNDAEELRKLKNSVTGMRIVMICMFSLLFVLPFLMYVMYAP